MSLQLSLAPFQGITGKEYRRAFTRHFPGIDTVYAPFISGVHPEKPNPVKFVDVLPREDHSTDCVPQFVSTSAREVITIAKFLKEHGYGHVNWNMGCPFSRLANKKRGCGILPYPDELKMLLDEVFDSLPVKLSIKCRLGYYQKYEIFPILEILNAYPVHLLIIHPRTGVQRYKGDVDLDVFDDCIASSKMPLAFNGDIYHKTRFLYLKDKFSGIGHWMLGRGALINPFLPAQIKGLEFSDTEKRRMIKAFHDELLECISGKSVNTTKALGQMKAVWYYMSGVYRDGKKHFQSLKICKDSNSYLNFVDEMLQLPFATDPEIEEHWKVGLKHI